MRPTRQILGGISTLAVERAKSILADLRETILLNEYHQRRRYYLDRKGTTVFDHSLASTLLRTKERLADKSIFPRPGQLGQIHTIAFFPDVGWHSQLLPPLKQLGPVSYFDSLKYGIDLDSLHRNSTVAVAARREANRAFESFCQDAARERPVDWIYVYASGLEILAETIHQVGKITKAPVVGMCLDDKQSWKAEKVGEQFIGQIDIAAALDLAWTSSRVACDWYSLEGGNPFFLPEGCSPNLYFPTEIEQNIDICFLGQKYGFREAFVNKLRSFGLNVYAAGRGWPSGTLPEAELIQIFRRSKIVLGHGGIGWSQQIKNIKGRDFDAPCLGSSVYLTSFNPELTDFFQIGTEIVCFSSIDECFESALHLLSHDKIRKGIAHSGRQRCLDEHTWSHRFQKILSILGILPITEVHT